MENEYIKWYKQCDIIVASLIGLGIDDLPDASWRDYHDLGMSPKEAVDSANQDYWDGALWI